jgi:shikimate dehydrogenase
MHTSHVTLARSPRNNPASLEELEGHDHYTITPIDHEYAGKTPAMWNALYSAFGMNAVMAMVVGEPSDAAQIVAEFRSDPKYFGGGSGSGFKERIIAELDELTPLARAIGAVNIIKREADGRLIGGNTDGVGYAESLKNVLKSNGVDINGSHVLLLGAGGTGRAIAFALANYGADITILNRTEAKARELAESVRTYAGKEVAAGGGRELISEAIATADAVVSVIDDASSPLDAYSTLGTMALPVSPESIVENRETTEALLKKAKPGIVVSDVRLRTNETAMLRQARELGYTVLDGVPMVINQGVAAFTWLYQDLLNERGISSEEIARIMKDAASF